MNPLVSAMWTAERWMVDHARTAVAHVQRLPRPPRSGAPAAEGPLAFVTDRPLVQPDRTSCGSASLVMLRMLRDPSYAQGILCASDPEEAFGGAALAVRRRTNAVRNARGRIQLPWPAALGTRPAAMIRLLDTDAGFGDPALRYHNVVVDPADPDRVFDAIVASVGAGEPVPLYIGDHRWMQHIVLVVRADDDRLGVYDPAIGQRTGISRAGFRDGRLRVAGWDRAWLAILGG